MNSHESHVRTIVLYITLEKVLRLDRVVSRTILGSILQPIVLHDDIASSTHNAVFAIRVLFGIILLFRGV